MGKLVHYVTSLHQATRRDYIERMVDDKVQCMLKAKEYETDYWDGDRRINYGGYRYLPGRWAPVPDIPTFAPRRGTHLYGNGSVGLPDRRTPRIATWADHL